MKSGDEQAHAARQVLAGAFHGVLSTHSLEQPGYPFGSVVPYVLDQDGLPLLLLSHLSQHTRNLDVDGRCGLTMVEVGDGDVQELGRLSGLGDVTPSGPDAEGIDLKVKGCLRRIPLARAIGSAAEAREVLVEMAANRH